MSVKKKGNQGNKINTKQNDGINKIDKANQTNKANQAELKNLSNRQTQSNQNKNRSPMGVLLSYVRPYWGLLLLTLLFSLIHVGASLYVPIVIGDAIDIIAGKDSVNFDGLLNCIVTLLACMAAVVFFQWFAALSSNRISFSVIRDIRTDTFNKLNRVPLKYLDSTPHGDIMSRVVNDSELVSDGLILGFTQTFTGVITIIGTIGFMLALNVSIALVVIICTPLSLIVSWLIAKNSHRRIARQAQIRGKMAGYCEEIIANQHIVKAFCGEEKAEKDFAVINEELKEVGVGAMFVSSITNPSSRLVNGIVYALVALIGGFTVINNPAAFSVSALVAFLAYANQFSKPFNEITSVVTELQTALASLKRVRAVLEEDEELSDSALPDIAQIDGTLNAEHVYFSYMPSRPLIEDFSLRVEQGKRIAIVGPTGCGKTTLINLLMRFYDPVSGRILMSGEDISKVSRSSVRSGYGMVLQETWLFHGTIRENIAYGKRSASDEEIICAAKKASIHNFIMRQPNGYDTMVSQNGDNISQGQKQLLTIARIMLTQPPMLILDEATSNIDTRTERRIQTAFTEMMKGRTSFVIAHRLSTIQDADLILVMNNGNVIESGTHTELLERGGFYSMLIASGT